MNSMLVQIHSLPALLRESVQAFDAAARAALDAGVCRSLKRVFLAGCGDSHHAALNAELAFEALAGLPAEPMTALQFARYTVGHLPLGDRGSNLVAGMSVSGEVSRTLEALTLARQAGAATLALTATPGSRIAQAAEHVLLTQTSPLPDPPGTVTPGVRSYVANQLALFLTAVHIGQTRGHLNATQAGAARSELASLADAAERTIAACDPAARALAEAWVDAQEFVFCGGGPNYGTALYSAAKLLEASGDSALGQDLEEWAHLQYFARVIATPTFIISAGERDRLRAIEISIAAQAIGRRVVVVCPAPVGELAAVATKTLPFAAGVQEMFTPPIAAIPGMLFAAHRADVLGEPFFRAFGGGRSVEGGGGISRVRTSELQETIQL